MQKASFCQAIFCWQTEIPILFGHAALQLHVHGCSPLLEVIQGGWPEDLVEGGRGSAQLLEALVAFVSCWDTRVTFATIIAVCGARA